MKRIALSIFFLMMTGSIFSQTAYHANSGIYCTYHETENDFVCFTDLQPVNIEVNDVDLKIVVITTDQIETYYILGKEYHVGNNSWIYSVAAADGMMYTIEHLEFDSRFVISPVSIFNGSIKREFQYH